MQKVHTRVIQIAGNVITVAATNVGYQELAEVRSAHGTSLAIIVFVASAAVVPYALAGNVDWTLVGMLSVGAALGVYAGARVMQRIPARQLRLLFGLFLFATAIRLLIG